LGVDLKGLVPATQIDLQNLSNRRIAVDAYNALYQFLAIIRQPDGTLLMDGRGRVTSHLSGLFYRTSNLLQMGIKVIYVFDGVPPSLKGKEIKRRLRAKRAATVKYKQALVEGKLEAAKTYAQATSRLEDYMVDDAKRLLKLMGVPHVQAPSEGEAQASHMTRKGDSDYCASQDYDSLLFGAPKLLRNVTISGRRKLPGKKAYVEVVPEVVDLEKILMDLKITREQLVDIGILVGTDYNPEGVKGIGPKTALKLIKEYGRIENVKSLDLSQFPADPEVIRSMFLQPQVRDDYEISWGEPDVDGIVAFLCGERDFSEERVLNSIKRTREGLQKSRGNLTLESFF